jgi:hypothetical protein
MSETNNNTLNEETKKFISDSSERLKQGAMYYKAIEKKWDDTPLMIKILNILLSVVLTYLTTGVFYNLFFSILFFIVSFCFIFIYNKAFAFFYLILYIIFMTKIITEKNTAYGAVIPITDMQKNNKPLKCSIPLQVSPGDLKIDKSYFQKDIQAGYFTYSYWIYITGVPNPNDSNYNSTWKNYRYSDWKSILYRGSPLGGANDFSSMTQFPGFWLTPKSNNLVIAFQQTGVPVERIELNNIALNKWVNVVLSVEYRAVNLYIDGLLERIINLEQFPPDMSKYNLYIASDKAISLVNDNERNKLSGFPGFLGELIYYNYALSADYVKESYNYYKNIVYSYEKKIVEKNNYKTATLITNSDCLKL